MAIDMNKMRARQTALKNKGGDGNNQFWRPQEGEQTIRIVTPADGDPFRDFWFHYEVGDEKGFLSPKGLVWARSLYVSMRCREAV